ncbi:ATP-binding protein [Marinobacterium stanieri]|uniref:ATP-binding protein n=1 Tax=Marinobacterium stanieri TaxID=49186 RepID=UPI00158AA0B2|nr:ATP-binding protein [Marinobacterium stanieri]
MTVLLLGCWVYLSECARDREQLEELDEVAQSLADNLSISIHSSTLSLYGIGELALQSQGPIEGLDRVVRKMRASHPNILNVAILPRGVVQQIEPLEPNIKALGHDMFADPERIRDALLARKTGKMTVTGPYNLIQGGQAVIARLPLYESGRFWGFVSIVYEFPELIESMLLQYRSSNLLFMLRSGADKPLILGNTEKLPKQNVEHIIKLPNHEWLLQLAYRPSFNWLLVFKILGSAIITLLLGYVYHRVLKTIANEYQLRKALSQSGNEHRASDSQRHLLARITHDLRAPLQHILNEARYLARGDSLQQANTIEQSVRYQLSLVDQLLEYSQDQERENQSHPEPGYTYRYLMEIGEQAESLADSYGNRFTLNLAPNLPAIIEADFVQLQRVLINLLSNAAKFTQHGLITLSVERPDSREGHCRLHFRVSDNGPGMQDRQKQGKHANSGAGLGLMIVTDLLRQMGSHLQYHSNAGGGSDFHFDLELPLPADTPDAYIERHVLESSAAERRVLLVDPDPISREMLEELLLGYGMDVLACEGIDESRQVLAESVVDLVITEMDLHDGSAWDFLKGTTTLPASTPVALYTSRPAQPGSQLSFAAELLRPAGSDQLLDLIQQLTKGNNEAGSD